MFVDSSFFLLLTVFCSRLATATLIRERRIVGGEPAKVQQLPYVVNIRKERVFHCGGALVTSRCVLTAAHCVRDAEPKDFVVRGGVTWLSDRFHKRLVERIFIPEAYVNSTFEHDVAILRLNAELYGHNIRTILIGDYSPAEGDFVQVSGWGLRQENAYQPSDQLHTVRLRVMQQTKCRALYEDYRNITESMFCASVPGRGDACSADSGGPAVAYGQLVGVVSWGRRRECGRIDSPGVYVRVSKVKKWIMKILYKYC